MADDAAGHCTGELQHVTDVRTGVTRDIVLKTPGGGAVISPDETRVAFANWDYLRNPMGGNTVSVVALASGAVTLIPGVHTFDDGGDAGVAWTPDSAALVLADRDADAHGTIATVRLLVWNGAGSARVAAVMRGDAAALTIDVVGDDLAGWG
jgi:DNA-binding beta-propeller fold protein YncE